MIKIAFFDVDGTLLRLGHKELSANTAAALRQLHQNGIILCMATGRCYTGVPHFDGIDFDVLLTFNGSFVTKGNDIIFKNPINEHDKYQIISNLKQMNRAIAISNEHMIVTNGTDPDLEQYFAFGSEKLKIADNFDDISRTDIYQIMCSCQKDEHSQILSGAPHSQITACGIRPLILFRLTVAKAMLLLQCLGIMVSQKMKPSLSVTDITILKCLRP